jgi:hypothetical protein
VKPSTKLGIGLGLLAVLYFVVVGFGIWRNGGEQRTPAWAEALDGVSSWFAPKLSLARLRCNDQPVASDFRLTEAQTKCVIGISRDGRYDYRKAKLVVVASQAVQQLGVYTFAKLDKNDLPAGNDCKAENVLPQFRLQIEYTPNDGDKGGSSCYLEAKPNKATTLTVLQDGGTLTLECKGCSAAAAREVVLRME